MTVLDRLGWLPVAPGMIAHEAIHAVTARLLSARETALTTIQGRPAVRIRWADSTPTWQKRVAHLAPTLLAPIATVVGGAIIGTIVTLEGISVTTKLVLIILIAANAAVFSYPSYEDRHPEVTS